MMCIYPFIKKSELYLFHLTKISMLLSYSLTSYSSPFYGLLQFIELHPIAEGKVESMNNEEGQNRGNYQVRRI